MQESKVSPHSRLNFLSRYTRAKEAQPIKSLYSLMQENEEYANSIEKISFALYAHAETFEESKSSIKQLSESEDQFDPAEMIRKQKQRVILSDQEEEDNHGKIQEKRYLQIQEKITRLQKMQQLFHQNLNKLEKEKEKRKKKMKSGQKNQNQLINVVESSVEEEQAKEQPKLKNLQVPQWNKQAESKKQVSQSYDDSIVQQFQIQQYKSTELNNMAGLAKLKTNIEEESLDFVESVEEVQGYSIVIDRLKKEIEDEKAEKVQLEIQNDVKKLEVQYKNFYETNLNHSQSEIVVSNRKGSIEIQLNQGSLEEDQQKVNESQEYSNFNSDILNQQQLDQSLSEESSDQSQNSSDFHQQENVSNQENTVDNQEEVDHVNEIDRDRQPYQQTLGVNLSNSLTNQLSERRKTLQEANEVVSIAAQSKEVLSPSQNSSEIYDQKHKQVRKQKNSFKKMIVGANKKELNPRMVISTIMNDQNVESPQKTVNEKNMQLLIRSKRNSPNKTNFKQMLMKNRLKSSRNRSAIPNLPTLKSRTNSEYNEELLRQFFSKN